MKATLYRDVFMTDATLGSLLVGNKWFRTIERPWLDNASNVSCIPEGKYHADFMARSGSGKYRNVWHLQDVVGRSGILVHAGNLASHSRGCIIVGIRRGWMRHAPAVFNSRTAMAALLDIIGTESFDITIENTGLVEIAA